MNNLTLIPQNMILLATAMSSETTILDVTQYIFLSDTDLYYAILRIHVDVLPNNDVGEDIRDRIPS